MENQNAKKEFYSSSVESTEKPKKKIEVREPLLLVACGKKGVGKSYTTLQFIDRAIKGNPSRAVKPQKVLLFDVNNEFGEFKRIALRDIKNWSNVPYVEGRRVSIYKSEVDKDITLNGKKIFKSTKGKMTLREMADVLFYILENFHDGILLIEDINRYVSDSLPNDLIGAICTQRHVGVDIILHFQNIGRFGHPKILGNANYLRLHKTTDFVARHEKKFEEYVEPLSIAEIIVNERFQKATSKEEESFYVFFDVGKVKIKGDFDEKEFIGAVDIYLETNFHKIVKPELNKVDLGTGQKKYKHPAQVVEMFREKMKKDYYGN